MKISKIRQAAPRKVVLISLILVLIGFPILFTLYKEGRFTPPPSVTIVSTVTDQNAPTLTFAADYDFNPYSFYDKNGNPSGLNIELATEIANRMHKRAVIVLGDWPQCKQMIRSSKADVLLGLEIFADESKTSTLKTIPISHDEIKIYGKKALPDAASLYGKKVGIASQSIITKLFELNCTYVGYQTNTDILRAVENGEVDYGICHASVASKIIKREGFHLVPSITLMESFPAMGIRETAPALKEPVNQVIKEMSDDGTITRLYNKWLYANGGTLSFQTVLEKNFDFYLAYLLISVVIVVSAFYLLSLLRLREENLKTALSYQEVLEREKQQAEAANRAKSAFLYNMSHDIRTPMNAVLGFNEIAIHHIHQPEEALDALKKAKYSGEHLMNVINDILDMSSIENGKLELNMEAISVQEHISRMEEMFRLGMEQRKLHFEVIRDVKSDYVYGDYLRLTQIIANLLSNAMKFTRPGGTVTFRIVDRPAALEHMVDFEIHVRDTGIGMSEEFQKRLFQTFEREKNTTMSGVSGTGLGLSIAHNLAELMGGTLTCSSTLGVGTEFIFSFTAKTAEKPLPQATVTEEVPHDFAGRRLLLVEDNKLNREIARRILVDAGFLVEEAEDGAAAVDLVSHAEKGHFDLILMDIQMPVMDGYTAAREIRSLPDPALAGIPIAAMTANAFAEDRDKVIRAGMNAHIAKPIQVPLMLQTIAALLTDSPASRP